MDHPKLLSQGRRSGMVARCNEGCVHVQYRHEMIHFAEEEFLDFWRMVDEAKGKFFEEGLKDLTPPDA